MATREEQWLEAALARCGIEPEDDPENPITLADLRIWGAVDLARMSVLARYPWRCRQGYAAGTYPPAFHVEQHLEDAIKSLLAVHLWVMLVPDETSRLKVMIETAEAYLRLAIAQEQQGKNP